MSHSLRSQGFFTGCVIGIALTARLAITLAIGLFGPLGGLADLANELSIVIALLAAFRIKDRFENYYDNLIRRRVLEEGFVKWTAELEARKATPAVPAAPLLRKVA
jgi:hypothetical protein